MKYNKVLPNNYYINSECYYPVLYLFHEMRKKNNSWAEHGNIKQIMQEALKNEIVPRMIIVMPSAFDTFYVDGSQNGLKYGTYFKDEFLPYIEKTYRINATFETRFVAELSMWGFRAFYYAFTHPYKFMYCYSMSSAIESIGSTLTLSISGIVAVYNSFEKLPDYTMDCETSDPLIYKSNQSMHEALNSLGYNDKHIVRRETHDWVFEKKSL